MIHTDAMRWLLAFLCCFAVVLDAPAAELGEARASMGGPHDNRPVLLGISPQPCARCVALSTTDGNRLTQDRLLTWAGATFTHNGISMPAQLSTFDWSEGGVNHGP